MALFAAVIALSTADPKRKIIKVQINTSVDKASKSSYSKKELSTDLQKVY